jgi:hypothetical protein
LAFGRHVTLEGYRGALPSTASATFRETRFV